MRVKFLIEKPEDISCDVFAFFPNDKHSNLNDMFITYDHLNQHSSCDLEYANECRLATKQEYQSLLNELVRIGYKNLIVENEVPVEVSIPDDYEVIEGPTNHGRYVMTLFQIKPTRSFITAWYLEKIDGKIKNRPSTKEILRQIELNRYDWLGSTLKERHIVEITEGMFINADVVKSVNIDDSSFIVNAPTGRKLFYFLNGRYFLEPYHGV